MSEEFDKKLINRINEVFDDFEDDSANEGWAELRKKFPVSERKSIALWWYSSAAAVLLIASIWLFSNNINPLTPTDTAQKKKEIRSEKPEKQAISDTTESSPPESKIAATDNQARSQSYTRAKRIKLNQKQKSVSLETNKEVEYAESDLNVAGGQPIKSNSDKQELSANEKSVIQDQPIATAQNKIDELPLDVASDKYLSEREAIKLDSIKQVASRSVSDSEKKQSIVISQNIPAKEPPKLTADKKPNDLANITEKSRSKADKNVVIGFYAGSFMNYAKGSETSINTGFGVSSDFRLSKKLKLTTGISLAQNSLKFTESVPKEVTTYLALDRNNNRSPGALNSQASNFDSNIISSYSINTYDAKLVGLDIPLNIKYSLINKKNLLFISTGFSSNIYINESYNYNYNYKTGGSNAQNIKNQESKSNFQSYNIGQVVNLSLGFERPFSNNTKLSLEPFLKYPLSGLGSHDLRFGAAGVNLKLNFNRSK
ncbi:MAG TPA: hypothetical protein VF602_00240 [Pedobacter sp.]|jgi:hypothetical protein